MKKVIQFIVPLILFALYTNAQVDTNPVSRPRHTIKVTTLDNRTIGGILRQTNDTSIFVYPGSFRQWNRKIAIPTTAISYSTINKIQTKKRHGIIKGVLIGAGIGILPVIVDAIFTPKGKAKSAEGGAYISILAVPLGTSIGGVIGATSKKRFSIQGDQTKFHEFRKKTRK